jgi:hypothetical protein
VCSLQQYSFEKSFTSEVSVPIQTHVEKKYQKYVVGCVTPTHLAIHHVKKQGLE